MTINPTSKTLLLWLVMLCVLLIFLLLVGCGQEHQSQAPVDTSQTTILWQGSAADDPGLLALFDETMTCLSSLNVHKSGYPQVIIVKDLFVCGQQRNAAGCTSFIENMVYVQEVSIPAVFQHEVVHWATGLGVESENTIYFTQCQFPATMPFCNSDGTIPANADACRMQ